MAVTVAAVALLVNAACLWLPPAAGPESAAAGRPVRLISFNLMNQNYYANRVQRFFRRSGADIILVQELADFTGEKLDGLRDLYPNIWPSLRRRAATSPCSAGGRSPRPSG